VPATALSHFDQDVARAPAIVSHADPLPQNNDAERLLRSDLLRSAWMFAVGALDAYVCDADTDVVAATIISKSRRPAIELPDWFHEIRFPVRAILEPYARNVNWRWRMAAREMMARESVLSLSTVQTLFNKFFRDDQKFFGDSLLDAWITRPDSSRRRYGINRTAYLALAPAGKADARRQARRHFQEYYGNVFQRRHDCIHNCDRPRVAPQPLDETGVVANVIDDVDFLVRRCDEHVNAELRHFLAGLGCPAAIIAQAGY